ncbi:LysE family translocator [Burkholderia gladioli]|uniref:LysE family translocator n=1 Tax=Burkholderia gladioli TaxID=28095 RepID=UPI00163F0DF6|nr:LysE family translocator [Burkholderia gladioli]MBU9173577.1 LysE family translocator [Burkholderia gladioli]
MGTMIEFVAVGGMLAVTPGPNMVYVMSRSVSQGPRAGLTSLAGVMLGYLTYMFGTAFGLTAIFLTIHGAARVLAAAGALYLLYLSWQAVRPGARSPFEVDARQAERPRRLFAMGAATSLLNPKLAMLFLSLLPQFIDYQAGDVFRQSMLLGASLVVAFAAVNGAVAIGSGSLAGFLAKRPNWLRAQRWVMGLMLFSLAAKMALDIWR